MRRSRLLLFMILIIATAGLVYELVMAAVASYLLGDSVTQFSIIIGVYLSALGVGAYLSRSVESRLGLTFVDVELAAALVGGLSAPGLFLVFGYTGAFPLILYATVLAVGVLVGLELPLLIRLLERELEFKELIARALTFDYAGALLGSLGFSLVLMPKLGLIPTSLVCGLANALVGLSSTYVIQTDSSAEGRAMRRARVRALLVIGLLLLLLWKSDWILRTAEAAVYTEPVTFAQQSPYQRIVLTESAGNLRLYLNGNLQFSADDEARYHEALVHPAMASSPRRRRVLIGGGGDGLAAREVLRWPEVESLTVVDLDPQMTRLAREDARLARLNEHALDSKKVTVINEDAMLWLAGERGTFDVIILDFPDPTQYSLGKLYSKTFYRDVRSRLAEDGALVVQATSPLFARRTFWSVVATLESAHFEVAPFHTFIPSFGAWGYVLARHVKVTPPVALPPSPLRHLTPERLRGLFEFPEDASAVPAEVNRLENQAIVRSYLEEWGRWN